MSLFGAVLAAGMLAGCGDGVDENKTPDQIKAEVANLDAAAIQKQIDAYKKAEEAYLSGKTFSVLDMVPLFGYALNPGDKDYMDQIKEIPLTEQLSDNAKKLQAEAANITKSLSKLKDNLEAYVEGLKAKAEK